MKKSWEEFKMVFRSQKLSAIGKNEEKIGDEEK